MPSLSGQYTTQPGPAQSQLGSAQLQPMSAHFQPGSDQLQPLITLAMTASNVGDHLFSTPSIPTARSQSTQLDIASLWSIYWIRGSIPTALHLHQLTKLCRADDGTIWSTLIQNTYDFQSIIVNINERSADQRQINDYLSLRSSPRPVQPLTASVTHHPRVVLALRLVYRLIWNSPACDSPAWRSPVWFSPAWNFPVWFSPASKLPVWMKQAWGSPSSTLTPKQSHRLT